MGLKILALGLLLTSCGNNVDIVSIDKSPSPKFKVGECIENPVFLPTKIGRITEIVVGTDQEFFYSLYSLKTGIYDSSLTERELELNGYRKIQCPKGEY